MLGIPPSDMSIDWNKVIFKGLFIKRRAARCSRPVPKMAALIQSGLDLSPIITTASIDEFQQGFDAMPVPASHPGKVILERDSIKKGPQAPFY